MKNKIICIITVVFLIISVFVSLKSSENKNFLPFYVTVKTEETTENITLWKNNADEYYIFLPSYAEFHKTQIKLNTETPIFINETPLTDGMTCDDFELNHTYEITIKKLTSTEKHKLIFTKSGNLPTMHINTESGNMDYIHNKKGNKEDSTVTLYDSFGQLEFPEKKASIKGRGNFTWEEFDKKPYSITFSESIDVLSMGAAQKWILLANADDTSNLRNKIIYDFADKIGLPFSPQSAWVDLYLNGEYAGLYLLCERNEVNPERVNISQDKGFLVSMELKERLISQNYEFISTNADQSFRIHYPLQPTQSDKSSLLLLMQSLENALVSQNGVDPSTGKNWQEMIDLNSWAKKYLIEEVFGNYDASLVSQYFYCNSADEKIYYGPVWDYDHSLGNLSTWQLANPKNLYGNNLNISQTLKNPWFSSLYQKEEFFNRMTEIYEKEFLPSLKKFLNEDIKNYSSLISDSAALNQLRWLDDTASLSSKTQYITSYMTERIEFLNNIWLENKPFYLVCADSSFGVNYAYTAVFDNECFVPYRFENTESSNFIGWFYCDTNEPFDETKPITEDISIYAKWQPNSSDKADDIIKLIPIAIFAVIFIIIFIAGIKNIKNGR